MPFGNTLSLRAWPFPGPCFPPPHPPGVLAGLGPGIACQVPAAPYWCVGCRGAGVPCGFGSAGEGSGRCPGEGAAAPAPAVGLPFGKEPGDMGSRTSPCWSPEAPGHRSCAVWHQPLQPGSVPGPSPAVPWLGGLHPPAQPPLPGRCPPVPYRRPGERPRPGHRATRLCPSVPTGLRPGGGCGARLLELCSAELVPVCCAREVGAFPWPGAAPRRGRGYVCPPSLPVAGIETPEPGRYYLKSLFCLCMEKYYLL